MSDVQLTASAADITAVIQALPPVGSEDGIIAGVFDRTAGIAVDIVTRIKPEPPESSLSTKRSSRSRSQATS